MKVAISGSRGLIGSALSRHLSSNGHTIIPIVRASGSVPSDAISWDPEAGKLDRDKLNGVDAVVHLAGENIAAGRWTTEQKRKIKESRIKGTRLLGEAISTLALKPEVMVSGSAIGFYGNRGDEQLTEASNAGFGFLAEVCREWEDAMTPVKAAGVRLVSARTGVVLSTKAGALHKMLPIFQLGGGGVIGDGRQFVLKERGGGPGEKAARRQMLGTVDPRNKRIARTTSSGCIRWHGIQHSFCLFCRAPNLGIVFADCPCRRHTGRVEG